jgi:phosphonate metabolism protein PhnN/1,5-bisphosphokinase (PRPP-forming)
VGVEIDLWLHAGFDVLVNGSRAHLAQAHARYEAALLPVCLQVSPDILRQRLQNRGRESAREIDLRLGARHGIPLLTAISSTTTEVCYSQSIIFYH